MELLNLEQNSPEWLEERMLNNCASEAPVIMGCSKFMTRVQLLDLKKGWVKAPNPAFLEKLYQKGHDKEDEARDLLSIETFDDYAPCVGTEVFNDVNGEPIKLLSSFDGRSDYEDHLFEHKLWNETLAANVRNNVLEPLYYWQLEHQLAVSGDEYVLFVVSDGTEDNREMMKYYPVPGRKDELLTAWAIFGEELAGHQVKAKEEKLIVEDKKHLPAITCSVTGSKITTNISSCLLALKDLANVEMNRELDSDLDFAEKDALNKEVKKARESLKRKVADIKSEFSSYSDFEDVAAEMDTVLQKMQSHGERQVKQAKDAKKLAIKQAGEKELSDLISECDTKLSPMTLRGIKQLSSIDFDEAMKNKRTIDSLKDAVSTCVNGLKIEINQTMARAIPNLSYLRNHASSYKFLFNDAQSLVNQDCEAFTAIVKLRISDHKEAEAIRLEAERKKIRLEEEAKAKREVEAKLRAEAVAKAEAAAVAKASAVAKAEAAAIFNTEKKAKAESAKVEQPHNKPSRSEHKVAPKPQYEPRESASAAPMTSDIRADYQSKIKSVMPAKYHSYIDGLDGGFIAELEKHLK